MLQTLPPSFQAQAARAGFTPGPALGEELFQAILDHPEGLWIGSCDPDRNLEESLRTENGRIDLYIPEMDVLMADLTPDREREAWVPPESYPLLLMAGRHMDYNANTLMRDPAWNKGVRACTLAMHPDDAERLNLADGASVAVVTEAGRETAVLEITPDARPGHVALPHGFGLIHQGQKHGANVNRLTKNTNRDPIAGTPLHRWVPCRVEPS
jgi:anaerobic selenocysteine-containing dehydrogenase